MSNVKQKSVKTLKLRLEDLPEVEPITKNQEKIFEAFA
jgi:hypothetical protein